MVETIIIIQQYQTQAFVAISLYTGGHRALSFAFHGQWLHNDLVGSRLLSSQSLYFTVLLELCMHKQLNKQRVFCLFCFLICSHPSLKAVPEPFTKIL